MASSRISNAGIADKRTGDGDALSLAAGKPRTPFADHRVHALRQGGDEFPRPGPAQRALDARERDLVVSKRDVGHDRVVEQERLLRHISDHAAPGSDIDVLHGQVIDPYLAVLGAMEPDYQIGDCRLAGARAPRRRR